MNSWQISRPVEIAGSWRLPAISWERCTPRSTTGLNDTASPNGVPNRVTVLPRAARTPRVVVLMLHQVRNEHLAFRLRADQYGDDDACSAGQRADQHWHRKTHLVLDREIGNHRRDDPAENRAEMVAEAASGAAHFGRET